MRSHPLECVLVHYHPDSVVLDPEWSDFQFISLDSFHSFDRIEPHTLDRYFMFVVLSLFEVIVLLDMLDDIYLLRCKNIVK